MVTCLTQGYNTYGTSLENSPSAKKLLKHHQRNVFKVPSSYQQQSKHNKILTHCIQVNTATGYKFNRLTHTVPADIKLIENSSTVCRTRAKFNSD